jgi:hypothetical protein
MGPWIWKMGMTFVTCNVRTLYGSGSLKTAASKLAKYNFNLVAVQEVKWDKGGSQPADNYTFFYGNGNANHFGTGFLIHKRIISAFERVEFISERMLNVSLRVGVILLFRMCLHQLRINVLIRRMHFMRN